MGVYLGSTQVDMQGGFVTGGASGASLQSKTVSPSESAQTIRADYGYDGLSQVTVNAVSRTYVGSGVTKKSAATYTPGTSDQSIASGQYLNGTQTIKGDSNLTAGNIRNGVRIFNVTGSYAGSSSSGGTNTSDATATAKDIAKGKTAYVQGKKVTGKLTEYLAGETLSYYTSGDEEITIKRDSDSDNISIKIHCFDDDKIMRHNSYIKLGADAILFGDATAADVAKGKTFTSKAGLKLTGTNTNDADTGDATATAADIAKGKTAYVQGVKVTGTATSSSGGSGNNNVEAYAITSTNPSVSFKRTDGTIKIWGYGTMTSQGGWGQQTTSLVAFEGDKYHKGAIYGGPSSTNLSLSISNGKLTGLPSGLTAISAIVTRGI
jgi:hypothetical protein